MEKLCKVWYNKYERQKSIKLFFPLNKGGKYEKTE